MIEPFNLDTMPPVAMYLFAGVDVQGDRLELSICGFGADGICHVLSHQRIWGSPDDGETWNQLSQLLVHKWRHPWGGSISISATCVDSGFATEKVYDYCFARSSNRVYAIKGLPGNRVAMQRSTDKVVRGKSTRNSGHLWLCGVHTLKMQLFRRMQSGKLLRFSADLDADYFDQLTSERITYVYRAGRRWPKFELVSGRENHALDTLVYAHAARASYTIGDWGRREEGLRSSGRPASRPSAVSQLVNRL
jgi:phage terminase large subunit GpA-like protein